MEIQKLLENIKKAIRGEEVRGSIHDAIEQCYKDATGHPDSIAAVVRDIEYTKAEMSEDMARHKDEVSQKIEEADLRIDAADSRISEAVRAFNVDVLERVLWEETAAEQLNGANKLVTLVDSVLNYDYIDIYYERTASEVDSESEIHTYPASRTKLWIKEPDVGNGTEVSNYLGVSEIGLSVSDTEVHISKFEYVYWRLDPDNGVTTPARSYNTGDAGRIKKIVGRKIVNNSEVLDIRVGVDGNTYSSAGEAVRGQIEKQKEELEEVKSSLSESIIEIQATVLNQLSIFNNRLNELETGGAGSGVTHAMADSLFHILEKLLYANIVTQEERDAFRTNWEAEIDKIVRIDATYSGGYVTEGTSVNDLTGIDVTVVYSDGSTAKTLSYELSGTINLGANIVTIKYGGKSTTIVVVGKPSLSSVSATYSGGEVERGTNAKDIEGIAVTAYYSDGTSEVITEGWTISGVVAVGTNIFTIEYFGKTTTVTVIGFKTERGNIFKEILTDGTFTFNSGAVITIQDCHVSINSGSASSEFINGNFLNISEIIKNQTALSGNASNRDSVNNQPSVFALEHGAYEIGFENLTTNALNYSLGFRSANASTSPFTGVGKHDEVDTLSQLFTVESALEIGSVFIWMSSNFGVKNIKFEADLYLKEV